MGKKGTGKRILTWGTAIAVSTCLIWPGFKVVKELNDDYRRYNIACVEAKETFVDFPYIPSIKLRYCPNKQEIEMTKIFRSKVKYQMFADSTPNDEGYSVNKIIIDGRTYLPGKDSQKLFDKANKTWKKFWEKADCDEILKEWEVWKEEEKKKQYGDTIDNLVKRID